MKLQNIQLLKTLMTLAYKILDACILSGYLYHHAYGHGYILIMGYINFTHCQLRLKETSVLLFLSQKSKASILPI